MSEHGKARLWIGWGCVAAAVIVAAIWWPHMGARMSKWRFDDPPAAIAVRAAVLILAAAAVFIIPGRRRGRK